MGIPDHLTCLLRNLYAGQEETDRTGHETTDWFQVGKRVYQGCILSLCLCNLYAECIMRNSGLEEAQAGIKITGRNINKLRYADDTTVLTESEEQLKSLLMKVKEESEKVGLKLNIQKAKIMASGPITSWEVDGETVETVSDFIFLSCKITADGDCRHEIKGSLLLGSRVMTNLDSILKKESLLERVVWFGRMALKEVNIIYEMNRQSRFDAWYRMLGAGARGWPRGMVRGGRWEKGTGWETHVHLWQVHADVWQNQYHM